MLQPLRWSLLSCSWNSYSYSYSYSYSWNHKAPSLEHRRLSTSNPHVSCPTMLLSLGGMVIVLPRKNEASWQHTGFLSPSFLFCYISKLFWWPLYIIFFRDSMGIACSPILTGLFNKWLNASWACFPGPFIKGKLRLCKTKFSVEHLSACSIPVSGNTVHIWISFKVF